MKIHDLKCWPHSFRATLDRACSSQVRRDDRAFEVGDILLLREWATPPVPSSDPGAGYTGRELRRVVTYLSRGPEWGIPEGYVVMSLGNEGQR